MAPIASAPRSPLRALLRFWPIAVVLCLVGALGGIKYADGRKATYTAESRLAVGNGDLSGVSLPGFAAAAESLAANYARYLSSAQAIAAVTKTLGPAVTSHVSSITASPFPDSNVLRVEVQGDSAAATKAAAGGAATYLAGIVNGLDPQGVAATIFDQFKALQDQLSRAQVLQQTAQQKLDALLAVPTTPAATLNAAEEAVRTSTSQAALLSLQSQALSQKYTAEVAKSPAPNGLQVVQDAVVTGNDEHSTRQRYGLAGLAGGALLALLLAAALDRLRPRRGRSDDAEPDQEPVSEPAPATTGPISDLSSTSTGGDITAVVPSTPALPPVLDPLERTVLPGSAPAVSSVNLEMTDDARRAF